MPPASDFWRHASPSAGVFPDFSPGHPCLAWHALHVAIRGVSGAPGLSGITQGENRIRRARTPHARNALRSRMPMTHTAAMAHSFPLDAYFARIGYDGPCEPTFATLCAVHERHAQTIPFENIDVVLGRSIPLDLDSLVKKLITDRRGGYCFEQNGLFQAVLHTMGFHVTPLLARVRWLVPPGVHTPQTHMALRVDVDGRPWLADAGFGGSGLMTPLALDTQEVQHTRYEPRRLVAHGRNLLQQVQIAGAWSDIYVLYPDEAFPIDFEVANWFTSTHPSSRFRQNLMAARADGTRRFSLLNRDFTVRQTNGSAEKRTLRDPQDLLEVLASAFGLEFGPGTRLECPGCRWD